MYVESTNVFGEDSLLVQSQWRYIFSLESGSWIACSACELILGQVEVLLMAKNILILSIFGY